MRVGVTGASRFVRHVQRAYGNRAVLSLLSQTPRAPQPVCRPGEEEVPAAPSADESSTGSLSVEEEFEPLVYEELPEQMGFVDLGRQGTALYGDASSSSNAARPRAFVNGGRTGTVVWAGGGGAGAHGNEAAGSIQAQVAPVFDSSPPTAAGNDAKAWVRAGTGTISVTRSWVGINSGNQGNGHFVTAGAAARINSHETQHVANSQANYTAALAPLEARVAARRAATPLLGASAAAAIAALQANINWAATVTSFQTADSAANAPGGSVDTADLGSGTYPVDAGPGTVAGVAFQHRVRLPAEADPAP